MTFVWSGRDRQNPIPCRMIARISSRRGKEGEASGQRTEREGGTGKSSLKVTTIKGSRSKRMG